MSTTSVRLAVEKEFGANSIMVHVAQCESQYRQFDENDKPLLGTVNPSDIGALQINRHYHEATAESLGLDLATLKGNLTYGHILYNLKGTQPWNASKGCWSKYLNVADST